MDQEIFKRLQRSCLIAVCLWLGACQQKMADQPRYEPLQKSDFFEDQRASRPLVEGTVAQGHLKADEELYTGKAGGEPAKTLPFPIDRPLLLRGQERFNIFCAPCHDRAGGGEGMIVRRGYRPPPSLHIERLRTAPELPATSQPPPGDFAAVYDELAGYEQSKGALRFPIDEPLPQPLVEQLVRTRLRQLGLEA